MGKSCKTCSVPECSNKHYANQYCERHYWQIRRHGQITSPTRGKSDTNEYIEIDADTIKVVTYNNRGDINGETLVSKQCLNKIRNKKICKDNSKGYYRITIDGKSYLLHRYLMNMHLLGSKNIVDHINRDPSDNRLENLRLTDSSGNNSNRSLMSNNELGIKNIRLTQYGTYQVQVSFKGKKRSKTLKTLEEALMWRNNTLDTLQGEYANLED